MQGIKQVVAETKKAINDSKPFIENAKNQVRDFAQNNAPAVQTLKQNMMLYKNETRSTVYQQQLLINRINQLKKVEATDLKMPEQYRMTKQEILELRAEIERLENKLRSLRQENDDTGDNTDKNTKKMISSFSKFGIALLGARSLIGLFRQGLSSALSVNEDLRAEQEVTSNIIGQIFVPAMKVALDMAQYLMIAVARLIKMFTGYDALAKVTTKNISNAKNEAKELNKQLNLSSIDEVENINEDNSSDSGLGMSTSLLADMNAMEEFKKKVAEVDSLFEKLHVQDLVDKLKELWKWIVDNKDWIIRLGLELAAIFGTAKIMLWVGNIAKLIGVAGGTAGLYGILFVIGAILALKAAEGFIQIADGIKKLNEETENANKIWDGNKEKADELLEKYESLTDMTEDQKKGYKTLLEVQLDCLERSNSKLKKNSEEWKKNQQKIDETKDKLYKLNGTTANARINMSTSVKDNTGGFFSSVMSAWKSGFNQLFGTKFASGTVAYGPTYGQFGEYAGASTNPEIVSPRSLMKETMMEAFGEILPSMQNNNNQGDSSFYLNGREFARAIYDDIEYEGNRRGKSTIIRRR